jgi:hypothetical protein
VPAGGAAEEGALPELGAGGVALAVLRDVRRAGACRVEAGDDRAVLAEHLAVSRGAQPAEGEAGVERLAEGEVVGTPRTDVLRLDERRLLVKPTKNCVAFMP